MPPHAVTLPINASLALECEFWLEDDGWNGSCRDLAVSVRGSSFEDAKRKMEAALGERLHALLRDVLHRSEHAA